MRNEQQVEFVKRLKREDPAASLFPLPSDYTIKDAAALVKEGAERAAARGKAEKNG